jgi:hypothetical protein
LEEVNGIMIAMIVYTNQIPARHLFENERIHF